MAGRAGAKNKGKVSVCIMCRDVFQCTRSDKQTCSDKCRKAWQRYNDDRKRDRYKPVSDEGQQERLIALINAGIKYKMGAR